ncbi:pimeloyl-ACP methyl ester carboxylesterase [Bradyrhizobium sp. LB7.2]
MSLNDVSVVLVHGAWADGSSWTKVIGPLRAEGIRVVAAPLPLTSLADDVAALDRTLGADRWPGGAGGPRLRRRGNRRDPK